ncbi:MAG: adenosylcobinamide amidohydrolase [Thermodesulfobacteriota bacterium]|nr:adenosylcobinamide amidohydrolase [Thermodesulfobacteriota bacterium]
MSSNSTLHNKEFLKLLLILAVLFLSYVPVLCAPVSFTDSRGNTITINGRPSQVVCLVPSITEIIFRLGAGDAVRGMTYHSSAYPSKAGAKQVVGGFFSPSLRKIEAIDPDILFVSRLHKKVIERFGHGKCRIINLETNSLADSSKNILLIGKIFEREKKAEEIVAEIKKELEIIAKKVSKIPHSGRKRVVRLMGRDPVMVPGDDSFQNEMIRAAGGIPPLFGKKGNIVIITKEEWIKYNPQVIYGCGGDRQTSKKFFDQPGWRDVEAVRNGKIFWFPCDLTCRASTNTGYFVSWLSARTYAEEFSRKEDQFLEEKITGSRGLALDLNYIKDARVSYSNIHDFPNKTLIIDFKEPLSVVSTLEGAREGIETIGNHYSSPPCWAIGHNLGLKKIRERVYKVIGKSKARSSFLFTGADMDNLAVKKERFVEMEVYALVTAGVETNAARMSTDKGNFYEPGTINIIILPNMRLTPRAMTRAIISATEAKTAALMDMDIRSSATPRLHRATGTGTDNMIVVQGMGVEIDNAGGHSKMGELIARAVYKGVREAIRRQNGLTTERDVFQRLKERKISLFGLVSEIKCDCFKKKDRLVAALEETLLDPRYADFIEAAFVLSDDYEKGLVRDLSSYGFWCKTISTDIGGKEIIEMREMVQSNDIPVVLRMALNAILNGLRHTLK